MATVKMYVRWPTTSFVSGVSGVPTITRTGVTVPSTKVTAVKAAARVYGVPIATGTPPEPTPQENPNYATIGDVATETARAETAEGNLVPMGPVPTGVTDATAVNAWIAAAHAAGKTAYITQAGTFVYKAKLTPTGPVRWGDSQTHKAAATFPEATVLVTATFATAGTVWEGSPVFDGGGRAKHCFKANGATKTVWIGAPKFRNALQETVVITSVGYRHKGAMLFGRTATYTQPKGFASLVLSASDCIVENPGGHGQEVGMEITGADCEIIAPHFSNTNINQGYRDTATGTRLRDAIGDSYGPVFHAATGATGASTITDATAKPIHQFLRVVTASGATHVSNGHIPATSYIGPTPTTASAGPNGKFKLMKATGTAVNCTGAVTAIRLVATHLVAAGNAGQWSGGLVQAVTSGSGTADAFNIAHTVSASEPYIVGPTVVWGHTGEPIARLFSGKWTKGMKLGGPVVTINVTTTAGSSRVPITTGTGPYSAATITPTTTETSVMAGAAGTFQFVPKVTGKVRVTITGYAATKTAKQTVTLKGRYSTTTAHAAPAKGATPVGSIFPQGTVSVYPGTIISTGGQAAFTLEAVLTGLTIGSTYWVDFQVESGTKADSVNVGACMCTVVETN